MILDVRFILGIIAIPAAPVFFTFVVLAYYFGLSQRPWRYIRMHRRFTHMKAVEDKSSGIIEDPCYLAPDAPLKVLTYNVWCHYFQSYMASYPSRVMRGSNFTRRLFALAKLVRERSYDAVMVQELFIFRVGPFGTTTNYELFAAEMRRAGLQYSTDPTALLRPSFGQNSGVCIFSRFPIRAERYYKYETTSSFMTKKGFVVADVEPWKGSPCRLVTCHLDAIDTKSKHAQMLQMTRTLQLFEDHMPLILAGDFNACPQHVFDRGELYTFLMTTLAKPLALLDVCAAPEPRASEPTHKWWTKGTAKDCACTLDHIFLDSAAWQLKKRAVVSATNATGLNMSDHKGLAVHILPASR